MEAIYYHTGRISWYLNQEFHATNVSKSMVVLVLLAEDFVLWIRGIAEEPVWLI